MVACDQVVEYLREKRPKWPLALTEGVEGDGDADADADGDGVSHCLLCPKLPTLFVCSHDTPKTALHPPETLHVARKCVQG